MSVPVTVIVRCPKCGLFGETGWATYQKNLRPLCTCGKARMLKATPEEIKEHFGESTDDQ